MGTYLNFGASSRYSSMLGCYSYGGYGGYGGYAGGATRITNTDISDLHKYLEAGNYKQAMQKYKQMNPNGNEIVRSRIENLYRTYTGQTFSDAINLTSESAFASGMNQAGWFGSQYDDSLATSEVLEILTGVEESKADKDLEEAGYVVGTAANGAKVAGGIGVAAGVLAGISKGVAAGFSVGIHGALIGALVGGVAGLVVGLCTKEAVVSQNDKDTKRMYA